MYKLHCANRNFLSSLIQKGLCFTGLGEKKQCCPNWPCVWYSSCAVFRLACVVPNEPIRMQKYLLVLTALPNWPARLPGLI